MNWIERQTALARIAQLQLFFVGGAPRSGTTWLQQMLDAHPDVSCRGEGLFAKELAGPIDAMMRQWRQAIEGKNAKLFQHSGGYPLPDDGDADHLLASAMLNALERQRNGKVCRAIGEKTPENVFFFSRIQRLFPGAKLIGIARDPRDVLASAWHIFAQTPPGEDPDAAKLAFLRLAIPAMVEGARAMIDAAKRDPAHCVNVTYEALRRDPGAEMARLFRFLGVDDRDPVVEACLARTDFAAQTGGRPAGIEQRDSFLRKGVIGDWPATLTPAMAELVLKDLGWTFPHFGWQV